MTFHFAKCLREHQYLLTYITPTSYVFITIPSLTKKFRRAIFYHIKAMVMTRNSVIFFNILYKWKTFSIQLNCFFVCLLSDCDVNRNRYGIGDLLKLIRNFLNNSIRNINIPYWIVYYRIVIVHCYNIGLTVYVKKVKNTRIIKTNKLAIVGTVANCSVLICVFSAYSCAYV